MLSDANDSLKMRQQLCSMPASPRILKCEQNALYGTGGSHGSQHLLLNVTTDSVKDDSAP